MLQYCWISLFSIPFIKTNSFPVFKFACIHCLSLISSLLLIIFMIGLSVSIRGFPSKFLKYSFHKCILSSWLVVFNLVLGGLISFTVCHAIQYCLSSTKFLILLIWF